MLNTNDLFKLIAVNNDKLYELKDEDIKAIQDRLLTVMDDVLYVCDKYSITYCLCGGSALGAKRHKGYIPWDEDLDITIPRKQYNKFADLFRKEFGDKYFVQFIMDTKKYDLNFMKIRVKGTIYEELFDPEIEKAGLFIDIFPLENTYDNVILRKIHGIVSEGLLFICSCVRIKGKQKRLMSYADNFSVLKKMIRTKCIIGTFFSFLSLRRWLIITEKWMSRCKNNKSKYVVIPTGRGHYFGEIYSRKSFIPFRKVDYEDRKFNLMNTPEEYLSKLYGDYMKVPPIDKRERHTVVKYKM